MNKKVFLIFLYFLILSFSLPIQAEEKTEKETVGKIDLRLLKAIIKIETASGSLGTGFIISKPSYANRSYIFLVTNKHLIGNYSTIEGKIKSYFDFISVSLYKKDGSIKKVKILLKDKKGNLNKSKVFPHPKPYIDVALVSIADDLEKEKGLDKVSIDLSYLATDKIIKSWDIDMGDLVFALGYPFDIYSKSNYYPIAKSGYISSKMGEEIIVTLRYKVKNIDSVPNNLRAKAFYGKNGIVVPIDLKAKLILLDGTIVGGNSGGPIIMPRGLRERTRIDNSLIQLSAKSIHNFIIGIQSQSVLQAGISFAFSSEYILEIMDNIF